jgi:hypothetical protein
MEKSSIMKCFRCSGPMAREMFFDTSERYWGWKCMLCGEIIDPVILNNRNAMLMGRGISPTRERPHATKAHL